MDSDLESELISLITPLLFEADVDFDWRWYSMAASVVTQIISLISKMDLHSQLKPESEFISLFMQAISVFNSIDLDSQPKPLSEFISLFSRRISLGNSMKNSKLDYDLGELRDEIMTIEPEPELVSIIHKILSLVISLNSKSGKFISVCPTVKVKLEKSRTKYQVWEIVSKDNYGKWDCILGEWLKIKITGEEATYFYCQGCNGKNHDEYKKAPVETGYYLHRHYLQLVLLDQDSRTEECYCCDEDLDDIFYCCMWCDFAMNMSCVKKPLDYPNGKSMESESELISLISQLLFIPWISGSSIWGLAMDPKAISLIIKIYLLVSSMDLNSQPKPESELMSLINQSFSLVSSMDLNSQPESLSKLILLLQNYMDSESIKELKSLLPKTFSLEPEPELISLIHQIISLVISKESKSKKFISLWPQVQLRFEAGKLYASDKGMCSSNIKWNCLPGNWLTYNFSGEDEATYFLCLGCNGENHEEYTTKAPVEIKHHLHRKHSLQLALLSENVEKTRSCYCCDRDLLRTFYCCLSCDFAMNMACVKKPPVLHIDHPKLHGHTLALFPRHASLTCNMCALDDASSPIYMCPPCDFVVHLRCVDLPRVIRISRHHHRISFTPSFDQEDFCCGICRKYIDNDYGGYFCIKEGCSYAVHSRCATQRNVWDGIELEGEPEEDIEDVEPVFKISNGIAQLFGKQCHPLTLDDNSYRNYEENKVCKACITPVYFGNFYYSMQCDFILHQNCANLSRKIYHPIHPHQLTLQDFSVAGDSIICQACLGYCVDGFFYECSIEGCDFWIHVQCATISEPLFHGSHMCPLFLTSKPEDDPRICSVCNDSRLETFNCIVECDFSLCFKCATLPQKVRYKHDKHTLALSYGDETSTMTYWCEVCEGKVDPKRRFYVCDEYCCVTIHIECLLGWPLYMIPGASFFLNEDSEKKVHVLSNNHHQTRPICSFCGKRCPLKIAFQWYESIFCSLVCVNHSHGRR